MNTGNDAATRRRGDLPGGPPARRSAGRRRRSAPHRHRPRHHPVRGRGRRLGQDDAARRAGRGPRPGRYADGVHRRHHLHGQGGRRAAPAGAHGAPTPGGRHRPRHRRRHRRPLPPRPRPARPGRALHAPRVRAADPDRLPGRSGPPPGGRRTRRDRVRHRLRGTLPGVLRRADQPARSRAHPHAGPGARHHPEQLRGAAERFDDNWDLVRMSGPADPRAPTTRPGPRADRRP